MQIPYCIERLEAGAAVFRGLLAGVSTEQARWKPQPEKWSLLEVINHLADEERHDFRMRLSLTLSDPSLDWPPIDPAGWVTEKRYNERDLQQSLDDFLLEREESLNWLRKLTNPDWTLSHRHPSLGPLSAGVLMASWLTHDMLHIRQMNRLHYEYLTQQVTNADTSYAGNW